MKTALFTKLSLSIIALGLVASASAEYATSSSPLSFAKDQTIIDLNKVEWAPLNLTGFKPGAEVAVLRGDLAHGSELIVRVPAGYLIPNHNHTSAETYIWLKGSYTYIDGQSGKTAPMSNQGFISLPGNTPPHAIVCGDDPCVFYLRYPRPFDHTIYPMPKRLTPIE
jgi:ChrR Cupin-like domain